MDIRKQIVRRFLATTPGGNDEVNFDIPDNAEHVTISEYNESTILLMYMVVAPPEPEEDEILTEDQMDEVVATNRKKRVKQLA